MRRDPFRRLHSVGTSSSKNKKKSGRGAKNTPTKSSTKVKKPTGHKKTKQSTTSKKKNKKNESKEVTLPVRLLSPGKQPYNGNAKSVKNYVENQFKSLSDIQEAMEELSPDRNSVIAALAKKKRHKLERYRVNDQKNDDKNSSPSRKSRDLRYRAKALFSNNEEPEVEPTPNNMSPTKTTNYPSQNGVYSEGIPATQHLEQPHLQQTYPQPPKKPQPQFSSNQPHPYPQYMQFQQEQQMQNNINHSDEHNTNSFSIDSVPPHLKFYHSQFEMPNRPPQYNYPSNSSFPWYYGHINCQQNPNQLNGDPIQNEPQYYTQGYHKDSKDSDPTLQGYNENNYIWQKSNIPPQNPQYQSTTNDNFSWNLPSAPPASQDTTEQPSTNNTSFVNYPPTPMPKASPQNSPERNNSIHKVSNDSITIEDEERGNDNQQHFNSNYYHGSNFTPNQKEMDHSFEKIPQETNDNQHPSPIQSPKKLNTSVDAFTQYSSRQGSQTEGYQNHENQENQEQWTTRLSAESLRLLDESNSNTDEYFDKDSETPSLPQSKPSKSPDKNNNPLKTRVKTLSNTLLQQEKEQAKNKLSLLKLHEEILTHRNKANQQWISKQENKIKQSDRIDSKEKLQKLKEKLAVMKLKNTTEKAELDKRRADLRAESYKHQLRLDEDIRTIQSVLKETENIENRIANDETVENESVVSSVFSDESDSSFASSLSMSSSLEQKSIASSEPSLALSSLDDERNQNQNFHLAKDNAADPSFPNHKKSKKSKSKRTLTF